MRYNYMNGQCDCVPLREASIIGHVLYPQLFEFKYVHCSVDRETGMVWYDERLTPPTKDTLKVPNCFVNLKVNASKVIQMFNRDSVTLLGMINMEFWEGMMNMDPGEYGQFMDGFEGAEGMGFDMDGQYEEGMFDEEMYGDGVFEEDYVDGDYADEWYDDGTHQDL